MKRVALAFLALFLGFSTGAFAFPIGISSSFTSGAAAYATSIGTSAPALITLQYTVANQNYADSGIDVVLTQYIPPSLSTVAPKDADSLAAQLYWARRSISNMRHRSVGSNDGGVNAYGASISVHFSDAGGDAGLTTANPTLLPKDSFIAFPIRALGTDPLNANFNLELAISRMLGSDLGYARRTRIPATPTSASDNVCFHTREGTALPDVVVPYLPWFIGFGAENATASNSRATSCELYFLLTKAGGAQNGCGPNTGDYCTGWHVDLTIYPPNGACVVERVPGLTSPEWPINANTGGSHINCTEHADNRYSTTNPAKTWKGLPLGDSGHNSVTPMNAKVTTVYGWNGANGFMLQEALQQSRWWFLRQQ